MSKLSVSNSPYSKPNTASSAWTRLVKTTKTASKTSRHVDAKPPSVRRPSSPTSTSPMAESSRPLKRRRVTSPQSQYTPISTPSLSPPAAVQRQEADYAENSSRVSGTRPAHTSQPLRDGSSHARTCAQSEGEPPLPNKECNLSQPTGISIRSPYFSQAQADLRKMWGLSRQSGSPEKERPPQNVHELQTGQDGNEGTAAESAEKGRTLDLADALPPRPTERAVLDNGRRGLGQRDIKHINDTTAAMPTCGIPDEEDGRATSDKAAQLSPNSSSLRGNFRIRRRSKIKDRMGRLDDGHEHKGQASTTENKFDMAANSEPENASAPPTPADARLSASTPSFHEPATQINLNRAPEPTQLATPTCFQSSVSSPNSDKENAVPTRKPKRRLTLHDTQPEQQKKKTRKAAAKQTVQTTLALAIGGSTGMRECKVCDTVYNPFHPEDVKVHAKRHAGVVRKERRSAEV